jgi:hypothetical protein
MADKHDRARITRTLRRMLHDMAAAADEDPQMMLAMLGSLTEAVLRAYCARHQNEMTALFLVHLVRAMGLEDEGTGFFVEGEGYGEESDGESVHGGQFVQGAEPARAGRVGGGGQSPWSGQGATDPAAEGIGQWPQGHQPSAQDLSPFERLMRDLQLTWLKTSGERPN